MKLIDSLQNSMGLALGYLHDDYYIIFIIRQLLKRLFLSTLTPFQCSNELIYWIPPKRILGHKYWKILNVLKSLKFSRIYLSQLQLYRMRMKISNITSKYNLIARILSAITDILSIIIMPIIMVLYVKAAIYVLPSIS